MGFEILKSQFSRKLVLILRRQETGTDAADWTSEITTIMSSIRGLKHLYVMSSSDTIDFE